MLILKKITICFWTALWISTLCVAQNTKSTYRNPVIAGDFPDPSIIRVGEEYYAIGTSGDYAPAYPIYHSTDLINWERIGAAFDVPPAWVQGDCWAPELFYAEGKYFLYYTARKKADGISCIGVASTADINQGFEDHGIIIEWGKEAIDAFVFKDDDGKQYILWKAYGLDHNRPIEILCSELSEDGLSLCGDSFSLTDPKAGWIGRGDEGACLLKRNGYYYLFYSVGGCCDRDCDYQVFVARAKNLKGKWEQYEKNPLLQGNETWHCPGHGTVVQTPDNRYFFLYHAYHAYDFNFVGRQALLDEICWDDTSGYPYFRLGTTPSAQAETPFVHSIQKRNTGFYDHFRTSENEKYWSSDRLLSQPLTTYSETGLTLAAPDSGFVFRLLSPTTGNFQMETLVMNDESLNFKGLCLYGNPKNHLVWGMEGLYLKLYRFENGVHTELFSHYLNTIETYLRVEAVNAVAFRFAWSENREDWYYYPKAGEAVTANFLPQWGRGVRLGIAVENKGDNAGNFKFFLLSDIK
jgi:beta-xylosidase